MINKINTLFMVGAVILLSAISCIAANVTVDVQFAYNGTSDMQTKGFKLYHKLPDGKEIVIADIVGAEVRQWKGVVDIPTGRSAFSLTAYSDIEESTRSAEFPFEYIEPVSSGLPAPIVMIKFN